MSNPKIFLQELEILVNQQVQYVLGMAARCPLEGDEAWSRVLNRYSVKELPVEQRRVAAGVGGLSRGAPRVEVAAVLEAIRALALPALSHIEHQHRDVLSRSVLMAAWVGRIRQRLESLPLLASSPADRPRDLFEPSWPLAAAV